MIFFISKKYAMLTLYFCFSSQMVIFSYSGRVFRVLGSCSIIRTFDVVQISKIKIKIKKN